MSNRGQYDSYPWEQSDAYSGPAYDGTASQGWNSNATPTHKEGAFGYHQAEYPTDGSQSELSNAYTESVGHRAFSQSPADSCNIAGSFAPSTAAYQNQIMFREVPHPMAMEAYGPGLISTAQSVMTASNEFNPGDVLSQPGWQDYAGFSNMPVRPQSTIEYVDPVAENDWDPVTASQSTWADGSRSGADIGSQRYGAPGRMVVSTGFPAIVTDTATMHLLHSQGQRDWSGNSEFRRITVPRFPCENYIIGVDEVCELDVDDGDFRHALWGYEIEEKDREVFDQGLDDRTGLQKIPKRRCADYASSLWVAETIKGRICWSCWGIDGKAYVKGRECRRPQHPRI